MHLLRQKVYLLVLLGILITFSQIMYFIILSHCRDEESSAHRRSLGGFSEQRDYFKPVADVTGSIGSNAQQYNKRKRNDSGCSWNSADFRKRAQSVGLEGGLVPNNVYYVWCGKRTFQFQHYLSVKSAWEFLRADVIEIHYDEEPVQNSYDGWLDDLKLAIPALSMQEIPDYYRDGNCNQLFGIDILKDRGGIYVAYDTILTDAISELRRKDFTAIYDSDGSLKVVFSHKNENKLKSLHLKTKLKSASAIIVNTSAAMHYKDSRDWIYRNCSILHSTKSGMVFSSGIDANQCAIVENVNWTGIKHLKCFVLNKVLRPMDIMSVRTDIADVLRFLYYGASNPVRPLINKKTHIPKIVHYVWYHEAQMTYSMYLSILSALYIVRPERIYVHGDQLLKGQYWDKIKVHPKVIGIYRETPRQIYGNAILFTHHKSDVIRAEVLLKYGGIYLDWDVIWLKPVDDLLSAGYDVILNYDHAPRNNFPNTINMGVVMAKPDAEYLKIWQKSYQDYRSDEFYYNPIEIPYKVYERYPWSVRVEKHLQVMCYSLHCHPVFHPDFKNLQESQPFDWRTDVYAIHFTHPDPPELTSETTLRNATGIFADIGRHVLKQADEL